MAEEHVYEGMKVRLKEMLLRLAPPAASPSAPRFATRAALRSVLIFVGADQVTAKWILDTSEKDPSGHKINIDSFFSKLFETPSQATPGKPMFIGTLNFLGNAYNAMEFLTGEKGFIDKYDNIRKGFRELRVEEVLNEAKKLGFDIEKMREIISTLAAKQSSPGDSAQTGLDPDGVFEKFCTKEFLKMDNKLELRHRTNMVVGGMQPTARGPPLFEDIMDWRLLMKSQVDQYRPHLEIALWDIACNLAAERHKADYQELCRTSYLNPERTLANVHKLLSQLVSAVQEGQEVVCAVQEFPEPDTAKSFALLCELPRCGLKHVKPDKANSSVGFLISASIEVQTQRHAPLGETFEQVYKALGEKDFDSVDPKDQESLGTTAFKTFLIDVKKCDALGRVGMMRFISVHAKEFKSEPGTKLLASYLRKVVDWDLKEFYPEGFSAMVLIDSNTPNAKMSKIFSNALTERGFEVLSPAEADYKTTRKKRSEMHGQIYDTKKCLQRVEAHKTFAMLFQGKGRAWEAATQAAPNGTQVAAKSFPDLASASETLLPNSEWPTDHCMLQVNLRSLSNREAPRE